MKTEIDLSTIESALAERGEATARQIATDTGLETKNVTHALNTMLNSATIEREKRSNEYVYWLTADATTKPSTKPRASAVAVQALHTPGSPADITEQLRLARAEHLAMSQTIVEVCCAIGHDPKVTTTGQLPQLVRGYIDAQINHETARLLGVITDIREAIGDAGQIMLSALAAAVKAKIETLENDCIKSNYDFEAIGELVTDYIPDPSDFELIDGLRTMGQLIDTQHTHITAQATHIEALEQQVTELRARVEAQILASVESASSASHLLTEVHDALANGWPVGLEAPAGRTTLQLAQAMAKDFDDLHNTYLQTQFPTPDAYLVTRIIRTRRGKKVEDSGGPTRHKSIDTATRQARSVIRSGYARAEIHATTLVAVATLGPEIKSV